MTKKHRIKAFTLSEMMVVLILTSIVVGLAFSVLRLVQKQMTAIQNNYNQSLELNQLETSLWLDFNRYQTIKYNDLEDILRFKNPTDSIQYQFTEKGVVKNVDTFHIPFNNKSLFSLGKTVEKGVIDAIKLQTDKQQILFVFKSNTAADYMNLWDLK